jgi:hypothetical protein
MPVWKNLTVNTLNAIHPPPSIWYLYLPGSQAILEEDIAGTFEGRAGLVVTDKSHGNIIARDGCLSLIFAFLNVKFARF